MVAKFTPVWTNVNNNAGGCLGMCNSRQFYVCRIMKEVPGDNNRFVVAHQVQGRFNSPSARMPNQQISLVALCNENRSARIKIVVQDAMTNYTFNESTTTVNDLCNGKTTLDCGSGCNVLLDQFQVITKPKFTDYLRAGWEISMTAAIDYTASNGEPSHPNSLHALGPNNQYINALSSVGYIVEPYDNDRMFPTFGFGGMHRGMGMSSVSHCFPINGSPDPNIPGIAAMVQTYQQTLPQISLQGPTYFGPILNEFLMMLRSQQGKSSYNILLILTDGAIHDMAATKDAIYQLADLPCSIIIIGVGNADFGMMEELDGDDEGLRNSMGQLVPRDIVQFVEFNKCIARGNLNEEVLKEVPNQVCSFMERAGIQPVALE